MIKIIENNKPEKMNNTPLVFLIIPVHNGIKNTVKCLENIKKLTYSRFRTIIVDDGSCDGSSEYISRHFPEVILIMGNGNLWWSGAVNKGVQYALKNKGDYICLLNNDNTFNNDFLSLLVETAQKMKAPVICSKVCYKNSDVVFYGGGSRSRWGELRMLDGKDCEKFNKIKQVEWITGMGVLIKSDVFKKIGTFDEKNFPQYYGDSDFGLRMIKKGYKILYQPESIIYNDFESTGFSFYSGKFKDLFKTFFSIKSVNNIRICFRFYLKHSTKYVIPIVFKTIIRTFYWHFRSIITRKSKFDIKKTKYSIY